MQYKVQQVSGFSIFKPRDFSIISLISLALPRVNHFFLRLFQLRTQQQQQNQAVELIFRDASLSVNNTGRLSASRLALARQCCFDDEGS